MPCIVLKMRLFLWFSHNVIRSSGENSGWGVSRTVIFIFWSFFPESSSLSLWGWRGETWRSKQKLCRFVIRKNVACFSCTNSKRTFFLKILKIFLGFFGIFVTAIFEGFSVGFGSPRNKRFFAVFALSGLSKKGRWPLMQRLRESL